MRFDLKGVDPEIAYGLLSSAIVPRPIAWVSTVGEDGVFNLAPFSFFAPVCSHPPMVGISISERDGEKKDTLRNIEATREFVVNVVPESLARQMNQTSAEYPSYVDEFVEAGLTPEPSALVRPPRVKESPIKMECRLVQVLELGVAPRRSSFVIGEVAFFEVDDSLLIGEKIDVRRVHLVGRLTGSLYCSIANVYSMERPLQ